MSIGSNLTTGIESAATELSQYVKSQLVLLNHCYEFEQRYVNILLAKSTVTALFELCNQVDSEARPRIEEKAQKIQKKLIYGEKVGKFLLEKPQTVDPRVEKLMGKIMQKIPSDNDEARELRSRHSYWRVELDQIASREPNALTAQMIRNGKWISYAKSQAKAMETSIDPSTSFEFSSFEFSRTDIPAEVVPREKLALLISSLQKIVESQQTRMDSFGAFESLAEAMGVGSGPQADRAALFLRFSSLLNEIHEKESPEKIDRTDFHWGLTALLSEDLSTPELKARAAQRLQVELLLILLFFAIRRRDNEQSRQLLDALEQIRLDPKDLSAGKTNIAHLLFEKFYGLYSEARKQDISLQDPDDQKFNSDFGRQALYGLVGVPNGIKQNAFSEVIMAMKKTWYGPLENNAVAQTADIEI